MRLIGFDLLLCSLQEQGLDDTYVMLERLFFEEPFTIIDKEGHVIKAFFDTEEIYDYLELLYHRLEELVED